MPIDVKQACDMLRQEFTKLIGEPIIEKGLGSLQGDNRSFYVDPLEEVFREILNIAADNAILSDDPALELTHEQLNKVMLYADKSPVSKSFYQYFFDNPSEHRTPKSISKLRMCIGHFQKVAMLDYGSFKRAFVVLHNSRNVAEKASKAVTEIRASDIEPVPITLQPIPEEDLFLLGYLSGPNAQPLHTTAVGLLNESLVLARSSKDPRVTWRSEEKKEDEAKALRADLVENYSGINPRLSASELKPAVFEQILETFERRLKDLQTRQSDAKKNGLINTNRYLTAKRIDVYFATSMRWPMDFRGMHTFVDGVMHNAGLGGLQVNCFDPTVSYAEDPRTKGLIECLMLKRARAAVYVASDRDSFGKDSELATMLVQGKPAIVFVPEGVHNDERARMFRQTHPLSMQVALHSGVAHGVVVVRTQYDCARVLNGLFTNTLELEIVDGEEKNPDDKNYYLIENISGCPIRIVSKHLLLTNCFWNLYFEEENLGP